VGYDLQSTEMLDALCYAFLTNGMTEKQQCCGWVEKRGASFWSRSVVEVSHYSQLTKAHGRGKMNL
jgi:hypothetical protein